MTFRWMEKVALSELSDGGQFESWEGLNTTYKTACQYAPISHPG